MPRTLPAWTLGLANLPLGLTGGLALLTVPQLLAARHVPEPVIAQMTTLALVPTFAVFLLGPVLDTHFSRRTYAIGATLLAALGSAMTVLAGGNLPVLGTGMVLAISGAAINISATGGWFGSLVDEAADATLGAWFTVANTAGFGLMAGAAIVVIRATPPWLAAMILSAPSLAPLLIYAVTPGSPPDKRLASENFAQFTRDLAALVRRPIVLRTLLLFVVPAASFALTNTLGGLGRDYHTSEALVALLAGAAVTGAGVVGSLLVPPLARRLPVLPLYLGIGGAGSAFTLSLIVFPHTPALFATALIGQNVAQAAALATVNVIALQSLGRDNPFAATQFALLNCASALPITYMQLLDGHAYGAGGLTLMYLTDGGLGVLACGAMAGLLILWAKGARTPKAAQQA